MDTEPEVPRYDALSWGSAWLPGTLIWWTYLQCTAQMLIWEYLKFIQFCYLNTVSWGPDYPPECPGISSRLCWGPLEHPAALQRFPHSKKSYSL